MASHAMCLHPQTEDLRNLLIYTAPMWLFKLEFLTITICILRRNRVLLILSFQVSQMTPPLVLLTFRGVWVLFVLKPEGKPIYVTLLRNHAVPRFYE